MSEDWGAVVSDVDQAMQSVGFMVTFEAKPATSGPEYDPVVSIQSDTYTAMAVDTRIRVRDANGLVFTTQRGLLVAPMDPPPQKGWRVNINGAWHRVGDVEEIAPGGVPLFYRFGVVQ